MLIPPSKLSMDERAFYVKVGFKSVTIQKNLEKQKGEGKYGKDLVIEDGLIITNRCYEVISGEKEWNFESENLENFGRYLKLLVGDWESFGNNPECEKMFEEKKAEINNARVLLESIVDGQEVSPEKVDQGIEFFQYLTNRCKENLS